MYTSESSTKFMIFSFLLSNVSSIALYSIMYLIIGEFMPKTDFFLLASGVVSFLTLALPAIIYTKAIKKDKISNVIPHNKLSLKSIMVIIAISLLIDPAITFFVYIFSMFVPNAVDEYLGEMANGSVLLSFLSIAVCPALFEEFLFRGFLLNGYRHEKLWKIALITGLFFAFAHMDLNQFTYTFPLGVLFAILVYSSGSIYASIIPHFIFNFWNLVRMLANVDSSSVQEAESELTSAEELLYVSVVWLPISLICCTAIFFLVKYFIKINKNNSLANENSPTAQSYSLYSYTAGDYLYNASYTSYTQKTPVFGLFFYIMVGLYIVSMIVSSMLPQ